MPICMTMPIIGRYPIADPIIGAHTNMYHHRTCGFTSCMHVCIMHYVFFVDVEVESGCPSPLSPVFGKTSSRGGQASGRELERG